MSSPIRTVLVYAATGRQGTSVVKALSAAGFTVRAAVRDLTSDKAKSLAALPGVELVHVDLSDAPTLTKAAAGADAVFAYTQVSADELAHGLAMADASKASGSVKLHIWSSAPGIARETNGELAHPIFDNKFKVDEHLASIGVPHVNLVLGGFLENFIAFPGMAKYDAESETITLQHSCIKKDLKFSLLWVKKDVGNAVAVILQHPSGFTNSTIGLGDHNLSTSDVAAIAQQVSGKKTLAHEDVEYGKQYGMTPVAKYWNDPRFGHMRNFELPNQLLQKHGFKAAPVEDYVKEDLLPFLKL